MYGSNSSMGYDGNSTLTPYGNDTMNDSASAFHECLSSVDNYNRGMLRSRWSEILIFFGKSSFREIKFFGKSSFRNEKFGGLISKHKKELQSLGERITEFYNRTSRASVAYQNITDSCLSMPPNFMERSFEFVNAHFAMLTADVNLAYMSYSENSTVGKFRESNFRYTGG